MDWWVRGGMVGWMDVVCGAMDGWMDGCGVRWYG